MNKVFSIVFILLLTACDSTTPPVVDEPVDTGRVPVDTIINPDDPPAPDTSYVNRNILRERKDLPGFLPEFIPTEDNKFYLSPDIIELKFPLENFTMINPQDFRGWEDTGISNGGNFYITPGDYTGWGVLTLTKPTLLAYYDQTGNPLRIPASEQAIIEGIDGYNVDNVILYGLTIRGGKSKRPGLKMGFSPLPKCDNWLVDHCIIEGQWGPGVRMYGSNNTFQNSIVRDKKEGVGADLGGIGIFAWKGQVSANNKVLNCEIYNVTDAVGVVYDDKESSGSAPGTIIDGNDFYITRDLYVQTDLGIMACAEDGVDFKNGGPGCKFTNNRVWGHRPTDQTCGGSGSTGAGMILQRNAKNWTIENNIFFDIAQGMFIKAQHPDRPDEKVVDIGIRNNAFVNLVDAVPFLPKNGQLVPNYNSGLAFNVTADGVIFEDNTVVAAKSLLYTKPRTETSWDCNVWVATGGFADTGNLTFDIPPYEHFVFYTRQHTGPDVMYLLIGATETMSPKMKDCN